MSKTPILSIRPYTEINIEGLSTYQTPDRGQFIPFDPKDPDGNFDYESSDSDPDCNSDSSSKSDTSSLIWDNVKSLQLGEYILE